AYAVKQSLNFRRDSVIDTHGDARTSVRIDHSSRFVNRFRTVWPAGETALNASSCAVHRRARFPQHAGDTAPSATRSSCHDGNLSLQPLHVESPWLNTLDEPDA